MNKFHIALTDNEKHLLERIDLKDSHPDHDAGRAAYLANREPIVALLTSLSGRNAIPKQRRDYWNDPSYQTGRVKSSHKGQFEKNGCSGSDIYTSPHFLSYLRYFLFGADLPEAAIAAFEEKVGDPRWVTSSDIVPLGKFARDLARKFGLSAGEAAEEFFRLCLDIGLGLNTAHSVMHSVKQLRY
jgi:hypothetical protein